MSAAQRLWIDNPRHYGAVDPHPHNVVYIGPTCPPPRLLAVALSDPEDNFVTAEPCRHMPQDQDDPREPATLAPETDSSPPLAAETKPPTADPVAVAPAIPKAPALPRGDLEREVRAGDSYFAAAARDFAASLVEMRRTRVAIQEGFQAQEAKQAERHAEATANAQLVASAIRAHGDRLIALEREAEQTIESITALKEEICAARAAADEAVRIARQALELVATLEERLPKVDDSASAPPTPAEPA
ncbi:MAG TPA: hypothetical protein VJN18_32690 [Polyangiaceae bacterium]|nr:hypothetical protein [Polyangiaceae bacterium]